MATIDPYHSPYPHPGQVMQEVLSALRDLRSDSQTLRRVLEMLPYELEHGSLKSSVHHLIKEAVNVALTEVINQERSKDDGSFLSYLERRTIVGRPAQEETESTDLPW